MTEVHQGVDDKVAVYETIREPSPAGPTPRCAAMGDDLGDLPLLRRVGLAIAPADAVPEVRQAAHWVTRRAGGQGAVREALEAILRARRTWA